MIDPAKVSRGYLFCLKLPILASFILTSVVMSHKYGFWAGVSILITLMYYFLIAEKISRMDAVARSKEV